MSKIIGKSDLIVSRHLGSLEQQVMEIIWNSKKASVRDVLTYLRTKRKIAYTTVMTVANNLYKKGYLLRDKDKKAYIYYAAEDKNTFERRNIKKVFSQLATKYGRGKILFYLLIAFLPAIPKFGLIFKISNLALFKVPFIYGFSLTTLTSVTIISLVNFFQNFIFLEIHEYLKLIIQDPVFLTRHYQFVWQAFIENFPIANLLILIFSTLTLVLVMKKLFKDSNLKKANYA